MRANVPELSLHPLVDTMAALMLSLALAAAWWETTALSVETPPFGHGGCGGDVAEAPPPLTVHVSASGAWIARRVEHGVTVPRRDGRLDREAIAAVVLGARLPGERLVVVNTDDGVPYGDTVAVLDLAAAAGLDAPLLAGGPP